ncbi:MAG: hypothetical protein WD844_07430 [Thermoleophilaceae bacterium]
MVFARNFAVVALVALVLVLIPGGGTGLDVALTFLSLAFFTAIALVGVRMYRQFGFQLDALTERQRLVLYGSVGLAFLTFTATERLFDVGGAGVLAWLALLGACSFGVFWVFTQARQY